jgi:hypothetical protein
MALQYPGSAAIPQYESSLAKFLPAFEKGQSERKDSDAFDAAAKAFGKPGTAAPQEQNFLQQLLGLGQKPAAQPEGPFTRPQVPPNAVAAIDAAAPAGGSDIPAGYLANARASESGGNDAAANPNSSALGRYQFLESTWNGLGQKYPELGLTADGRTDPAQQERAMAKFTQDNASALQQAGIPVNPGTLYAAHFLGAGGATKALSADPSTPMSAVVDPGVIEANPQLRGQTVGDFAQWANGKGGNSSGGYQPPMRDEGAGQGQPFTPDADTMRTLLASEATRPLALGLIKAQQETQASQGRYVTEQGQDGSIWQRDTLTGAQTVLQAATKPALPTDDMREYEFYTQQETGAGRQPKPFGEWLKTGTTAGSGLSTQPTWGRDAQGNSVLGQIGADGAFHPTQMPDGVTPIDPGAMAGARTSNTVDAKSEAAARGALPAAEQAYALSATTLAQINKNSDGLADNFGNTLGMPNQRLPARDGSARADLLNQVKQLGGQAFLQIRQALKGAGQVTDYEGQKGEIALTRMAAAIENGSKADFDQALVDYQSAMDNGLRLLREQANGGYNAGAPAVTTQDAPAPLGGNKRLVYNPETGDLE